MYHQLNNTRSGGIELVFESYYFYVGGNASPQTKKDFSIRSIIVFPVCLARGLIVIAKTKYTAYHHKVQRYRRSSSTLYVGITLRAVFVLIPVHFCFLIPIQSVIMAWNKRHLLNLPMDNDDNNLKQTLRKISEHGSLKSWSIDTGLYLRRRESGI